MIAIICAAIYLVVVFFSIFVLIPYLVADGTIAPWDTEDAVVKAILWPFHLLWLSVAVVIVTCCAVVYIPFDFLFDKSVKYFVNRKKKTNETSTASD